MNNVDSYINNENYNNVSQLKCKPTFTNLPNTFRSVCLDLKYVKYGEIWVTVCQLLLINKSG